MSILRSLCCVVVIAVSTTGFVVAQDIQTAPTPTDQSEITRLAPLLPAVVPTDQSAAPETGKRPFFESRKAKSALTVAEGTALAFLLDSTVASVSSRELQDGEICKLSDMFSDLGGAGGVGLLGLGYITGGKHTKKTCGTAFKAAGEAMVITSSLKFLVGRMRPVQSGGDPDEFRGPGSGYTSFPSGHTSNAFAIATVFAHEYPKRKWLYYALATGVGLSRLQKQSHFTSDVFVGAAIGVYAGRKAVKGASLTNKMAGILHREKTHPPVYAFPPPPPATDIAQLTDR